MTNQQLKLSKKKWTNTVKDHILNFQKY